MRQFDLAHFDEPARLPPDTISLVAAVFDDGNDLVLAPAFASPGALVRISKASVVVVEKVSGLSSALAGDAFHVIVPANSQCAVMQRGCVRELLCTPRPKPPLPKTLLVKLDATGEGTITFDGVTRRCVGEATAHYPDQVTIDVANKFRRVFSPAHNLWMDYAILIQGPSMLYLHAGAAVLETGAGDACGRIALLPADAARLFDWITGPTQIAFASGDAGPTS